MAFVTLHAEKLKQNYCYLNTLFHRKNIKWSVVAKLLCGQKDYLKVLIELGLKQICDSRIGNLRSIKSIAPNIETIFIKPPAKRNVRKVVEFADISFNTSYDTIKALSDAAVALDKTHKIVIMVELGELREGVLEHELENFYQQVFNLPNIEVIGLGANLTCMYGVLPSNENLQKLEHYKELIETRFNRKIPILSGGTSVSIPLIFNKELPKGINHFRIGESLFFGTDVYNNSTLEGMHQDIFKLYAEIIELEEKPNVPTGELGYNLTGEIKTFDPKNKSKTSIRAIVDVGLLDVDAKHLEAVDKSISIAGASSDMIVLDLGDNENNYEVGDKIEFRMDYMGTLRIMHSKYVEKRIEQYIPILKSKEMKLENAI